MATNELIRKLTELADLRKMAEDLNAEIEAIQDEIKNHMTAEDIQARIVCSRSFPPGQAPFLPGGGQRFRTCQSPS